MEKDKYLEEDVVETVEEIEEVEDVTEVETVEEGDPISEPEVDILGMLSESMKGLQAKMESIEKAISTIRAAVPVNKEPKEEEEKTFEDYFN